MDIYSSPDDHPNEEQVYGNFTSDTLLYNRNVSDTLAYNAGYDSGDFSPFEQSQELENISSPEDLDIYKDGTRNLQPSPNPVYQEPYRPNYNRYGMLKSDDYSRYQQEYQAANDTQNYNGDENQIQRRQSQYVNQNWDTHPNNNYKYPPQSHEQHSSGAESFPSASWSNSGTLSTLQASQIKALPKTFAEFKQHVVTQRNVAVDTRTTQIVNQIKASALNSNKSRFENAPGDISQQIDMKQELRLKELRRQLKKEARIEKKEQLMEQKRKRTEKRQEKIKEKEIKKQKKLQKRKEKFHDVFEVSNILAKVSSENKEGGGNEMTPAQKFLEVRRQLRKAEVTN